MDADGKFHCWQGVGDDSVSLTRWSRTAFLDRAAGRGLPAWTDLPPRRPAPGHLAGSTCKSGAAAAIVARLPLTRSPASTGRRRAFATPSHRCAANIAASSTSRRFAGSAEFGPVPSTRKRCPYPRLTFRVRQPVSSARGLAPSGQTPTASLAARRRRAATLLVKSDVGRQRNGPRRR